MYEFLDALLTCQTAPEEVLKHPSSSSDYFCFYNMKACRCSSRNKMSSRWLTFCYVPVSTFLFPQAFRKFDEMNGKLTEQLRKLAKQVVYLVLMIHCEMINIRKMSVTYFIL